MRSPLPASRRFRGDAGFGLLGLVLVIVVLVLVVSAVRWATRATSNPEMRRSVPDVASPGPPPGVPSPGVGGGLAPVVPPPAVGENCLTALAVFGGGENAGVTHGAGARGDCDADWSYECVNTERYGMQFKVKSARMVMWANGDKITGFKFRYRPVPRGDPDKDADANRLPAAQNWSPWAEESGPTARLEAGAQGQSYNPLAAWSLQIELEFVRPGFNYVYRYAYPIINPQCGLGRGGGS
jgi:hypothetical protein